MVGFHRMNIIDYLIGNTDRHWANWGFRVDNETNKLGKLYPLMDFNRSFRSYDTIDGARCLTTKEICSQKEAAIIGVRKVGLGMVHSLPENLSELFNRINTLFGARLDIMFEQRLNLLKNAE